MPVYRNILVAIDCSPVDNDVIEQVSTLALQVGATVHLLHVIHSHTLDQDRTLRADAVILLDDYRQKMHAEGIDSRIVIRSGEPDREILKEIEENSYDLLAMATHGHNLLGRILFGSVSRSLRQKITIPLLLIKAEQNKPARS
ncbi:MAG: universal stress protein [Chlorobiaceae bacterium]|nr:universal stress protein [Chlorobiaceae bacterium]